MLGPKLGQSGDDAFGALLGCDLGAGAAHSGLHPAGVHAHHQNVLGPQVNPQRASHGVLRHLDGGMASH